MTIARTAGIAVGALLLVLTACRRAPEPDREIAETPPPPADSQLTFDPSRLRAGNRIGTLTVDTAAVAWSEVLSTWTGTVRFGGEIPLRGRLQLHFDYPGIEAACFEADSSSALRLPRWPDDERRPWFCFENDSVARRVLGSTDTSRFRRITVDRFTTVRAFTDAVNSARLLEADACFRSGGGILTRLGLTSDTAAADAWLRFDRGLAGDSGMARITEANGATLAVAWARGAREALELRGADDFLQFEALLAHRGDSLSGEARLSSDAQLERDDTGAPVPAAARWRLEAVAAACDSAPSPATGRRPSPR